MDHQRTILLTGATGYVGGRLLPDLLAAGHRVRCLVRDPSRARGLPDGAELVQGDVVSGDGLAGALAGADVAYYLVHSMGNGSGGDFARRDRDAAATFGRAVRDAGVARTIYLGGLEDDAGGRSEHLRSRNEVAEVLRELVPELVHVRAAMVVGDGSASFQMLRSLVDRLPAMVCPRWIDTRTQPVAIADVRKALAALATAPQVPEEVQLGGADVLTYRDMLRRYARLAGRREPVIVRVPVLSPRLSSYWVGLVTPVDAGLARPLVEGLSAEMLVRQAPPAGINDAPLGFDEAVRRALDG
ncbi:MAG TPA: NAD(P)H-binding protein [Baekduia sp.]|nr:NAD(P)H-binding protein [Baekduia sp.]